jgi:SNF2 family DNA or RNA helicase
VEYELSSSKVNAAMKEVIRIRKECSNDKVIIVSQFTSFLDIIQTLLVKEGFSFVRLDGSMSQSNR